VGLKKDEESLRRALAVMEDVKDQLPRMVVRDKSFLFNRELIEAIETYNMVIVAEMIVRASLLRKESRGVFIRVDYPRSDDRYLGHFYIRKSDDKMSIEFKPVMVEKAVDAL
jgi:succinate dehydrogenase/fumarate reductase flavoprotein subunit